MNVQNTPSPAVTAPSAGAAESGERVSLRNAAPSRRRLPNRRDSDIITFDHNGLHVRAQFSRFADGSLGEIFLDIGKPGSAAQIAGHDAAVCASLALQFGCDPDTLHHAFAKLSTGMSAGPVGAAFDLIGDAP